MLQLDRKRCRKYTDLKKKILSLPPPRFQAACASSVAVCASVSVVDIKDFPRMYAGVGERYVLLFRVICRLLENARTKA